MLKKASIWNIIFLMMMNLEGVKIKIIIDGIGTKILKRKRLRELEKAGIKVKTFFPSHFPFFRLEI